MITTRIDEMISMLRAGDILSQTAFEKVDLNKALAIRHSDHYRFYYQRDLHDRYRISGVHSDLRAMHVDLQRLAYSVVEARVITAIKLKNLKMCENDIKVLRCDLANYIGDELADIAKCRATEYRQEWYACLWDSFLANEVPMLLASEIVAPKLKRAS